MTFTRILIIRVALISSSSVSINWRTVWLEPNPVILQPGSSRSYVVKGIDGRDNLAELTHNPYLRIMSSNEDIVAVDREAGRLLGKSVGRVEIRASFSECTSLITATVRDPLKTSE
jgi:hypothetical protein